MALFVFCILVGLGSTYRLSSKVCVRGPTPGMGLRWGRGVFRTSFGNLRHLSFWKKIAFFCRTTQSAPKLTPKKVVFLAFFPVPLTIAMNMTLCLTQYCSLISQPILACCTSLERAHYALSFFKIIF